MKSCFYYFYSVAITIFLEITPNRSKVILFTSDRSRNKRTAYHNSDWADAQTSFSTILYSSQIAKLTIYLRH